MHIPEACTLCPRNCKINRKTEVGYCRGGKEMKIASATPHYGEERCISGHRGSGTIFFTGCGLGCAFCQNMHIRDGRVGQNISIEDLVKVFFRLQKNAVHNINLVTPTHYRPWIQESIKIAREKGFDLPIVWNTSGYENTESIKSLEKYVDVWLYDFKFYKSELSEELAQAPDYFSWAFKSLKRAYKQSKELKFDRDGLLQKGIVIRMLVLPGQYEDSIDILEKLAAKMDPKNLVLALMRQYRPPSGAQAGKLSKEMQGLLSYSEFRKVVDSAQKLGFSSSYFQ